MWTLKPQSNGPLYSNTVIGTLVVDGWAVKLILVQRGGACAGCGLPRPLLIAPNVAAYQSTASTNFTSFDVAL